MKALEEFLEQKRTEFLSHVKPEIQELYFKQEEISWGDYEVMLNHGLNSYEAKLIEPLLDDEAFLMKAMNAEMGRSTMKKFFELPESYDDWILTDGFSEMVKRLQKHLTT